MPRFFYHATTMKNYNSIMESGYIKPSSGNTYTNTIFLAQNDYDARVTVWLRHLKVRNEKVAIFKIPKYFLKKALITRGDNHTGLCKGPVYKYPKPIEITDEIWTGFVNVNIDLPEGVSIMRQENGTAGFSFTQEAYDRLAQATVGRLETV